MNDYNMDLENISVVKPGTTTYDQLQGNKKKTNGHNKSTPFYNSVVTAINEAEVGDILLIPLPPGVRGFNLPKILYNRGFSRGSLNIFRQEQDASGRNLPPKLRPMRIEKMKNEKGRIVNR